MKLSFPVLVLAFLVFGSLAEAEPLKWALLFTFPEGGKTQGSFTFDADTGNFTNVAITTGADSESKGYSYSAVSPLSGYESGASGQFFVPGDLTDYTGTGLLFLQQEAALTDEGGAIPTTATEYECQDAVCSTANLLRNVEGLVSTLPDASPVPEPSPAYLLGAALAIGGLAFRLR